MRRAHGSTSQPVLRTAALLLDGAMALHQLRYLLAPGADDVLGEHGHGYLPTTWPVGRRPRSGSERRLRRLDPTARTPLPTGGPCP